MLKVIAHKPALFGGVAKNGLLTILDFGDDLELTGHGMLIGTEDY